MEPFTDRQISLPTLCAPPALQDESCEQTGLLVTSQTISLFLTADGRLIFKDLFP